MKLPVLSLIVGLAAARANCSQPDTKSLTVKTESGAFTGMIDPEHPRTRQWRSIPFAEPPVGARRFLPPQKYAPANPDARPTWSTKYPPSCPQFLSQVESMWNMNLTKGNLAYNGAQNDTSGLVGEATSEDCLHLAVWAPTEPKDVPKGGLPVLFFMTGGGFVQGGVDLPWQIPTGWVDREQSFIAVSINYRLNIFGFPNARGLPADEQNLGIMDQRLALEWVRDNIAAFGGDPSRIMQWGRSAGSVSVDVHAYAYAEDPIAESYYAESGAAHGFNPPYDPIRSNFTFVAQNVGCGEPCGPSGCADDEELALAELDCMRGVSMIQISNFIGQYADRGEQPPIAFNLIRDDKIYFHNYTARSVEGKLAHVPSIFSYTANEFSSLQPWPASNLTEGPWWPPIAAGNMQFAVCGGRNATWARNNIDMPVFRFQYAAEFPNLNVYDWLGAYHNAETPLVFGTYHLLDHIAPSTEFQEKMSLSIQEHILAFAMDPYNGPQTLGWQPMDLEAPGGGFILRFGGKSGNLTTVVDGIEIDGACLGLSEYDAFP